MAIDGQMFRDDLATAIDDIPSTLTFGAESCSCVASPVNRTDDVDPTGILTVYDLGCSFSADALTAIPNVRDVVTVDSVNYHVVSKDNDGTIISLTLRRV